MLLDLENLILDVYIFLYVDICFVLKLLCYEQDDKHLYRHLPAEGKWNQSNMEDHCKHIHRHGPPHYNNGGEKGNQW